MQKLVAVPVCGIFSNIKKIENEVENFVNHESSVQPAIECSESHLGTSLIGK